MYLYTPCTPNLQFLRPPLCVTHTCTLRFSMWFFFARRFCMWVVCIYALYLYLYLEVHLTKRSTRLVPGRRECSHMTWRRNHRVRAHGHGRMGVGRWDWDADRGAEQPGYTSAEARGRWGTGATSRLRHTDVTLMGRSIGLMRYKWPTN